MKILGLEIRTTKQIEAEQRNTNISYPTFSDALNFSGIGNNYGAMNLSAVYRATEIISDSIAILPIRIKEDKKEHLEEINHPLQFAFSNGVISKYTLIKLLVQSVLLRGNGYAYIERGADGTVTGLRYLDSSEVQINYDKVKRTLSYTCNSISPKRISVPTLISSQFILKTFLVY